jgi:hypothetical protein
LALKSTPTATALPSANVVTLFSSQPGPGRVGGVSLTHEVPSHLTITPSNCPPNDCTLPTAIAKLGEEASTSVSQLPTPSGWGLGTMEREEPSKRSMRLREKVVVTVVEVVLPTAQNSLLVPGIAPTPSSLLNSPMPCGLGTIWKDVPE